MVTEGCCKTKVRNDWEEAAPGAGPALQEVGGVCPSVDLKLVGTVRGAENIGGGGGLRR